MFSKEHRSGIFLLFIIIVVLQISYFGFKNYYIPKNQSNQDEAWLSMQDEIDSLKQSIATKKDTIYPFNPNFITDYKGYKLGLSIAEIDRLHQFRSKNKYVNSAKEFQTVTKVSDQVLQKIAPYFKFPDWVTNKSTNSHVKFEKFNGSKKVTIVQKDINFATKEDLIAVYGIGENKILIEKEKFGCFVSMEQFEFMWGISPEASADLQKRFFIKNTEAVKKLAINDLSINELAKFPYFNYALAKEIVVYRSMNNGIKETADLTKIKGMPNEKIKIIALYLIF